MLEIVRLHSTEIEDVIVAVLRTCMESQHTNRQEAPDMIHTSPRWASKHNGVFGQRLQPLLENIETVALNPPDLGCYTIYLGIMTCTGKCRRVFFDSKDLFEAAR
jgi:hypothetical protein